MAVSADAIKSVIAAEAGLKVEDLRPDATLVELDIGSLDVVSALFAIEDEFGIEVEPESIDPTATVSQLIEQVMSQSEK